MAEPRARPSIESMGDAGAKADEFFTPSEVVNTLLHILEPRPGGSAAVRATTP